MLVLESIETLFASTFCATIVHTLCLGVSIHKKLMVYCLTNTYISIQ